MISSMEGVMSHKAARSYLHTCALCSYVYRGKRQTAQDTLTHTVWCSGLTNSLYLPVVKLTEIHNYKIKIRVIRPRENTWHSLLLSHLLSICTCLCWEIKVKGSFLLVFFQHHFTITPSCPLDQRPPVTVLLQAITAAIQRRAARPQNYRGSAFSSDHSDGSDILSAVSVTIFF